MIGTEWKIAEKLIGLKSEDPEDDWKITYTIPIYGDWDIIVECSFSKLKDLEKIISFCRIDQELSQWAEEIITLIGSKNNFST